MSLSLVPLKTRRERCALNLFRLKRPPVGVMGKLGEAVTAQVSSSTFDHGSKFRATRGLLATGHVILNYGQVTWTTPELAPPPFLTTPPHQREDISALDRFNEHRCPTRRVFSGTGHELVTRQATIRYLYHSATAATLKRRRDSHKSFKKYGLIKAIKLEGQKTVTSNWHTTKCLPEILQEVNVRGLMLYHDKASSHTARLTVELLQQKEIKVIEHPPYSLDLAMFGFWLFIDLKKNLRGRRFPSEEIDVAKMPFFHQFQEMNGSRHLICGKFVYKGALIYTGGDSTLNTPKILPLKIALRFYLDDEVKEAEQDFFKNQPRSFPERRHRPAAETMGSSGFRAGFKENSGHLSLRHAPWWTSLIRAFQVALVLDESRSFFRVHTGYFSNIPKCIKAEFIASWACSQSSVVSSSKR
ncbi:histone-lysine N-methyltransferase SETMAR [Trichonephila clavipes]|nr:histone-lysine N-methyltransferase SETMAR [Trichonephila clavipes]